MSSSAGRGQTPTGSQGIKKDPVWKHCKPGPKTGQTICNYCGDLFSGGPNRMKYHLSRISCRDVRPCPQVEVEAQREMNAFLEAFEAKKNERKRTQFEMARPPQPPPPPFPPSSEEIQSSVGPRVRHGSASSSAAGGLDFFVSRSSPGSQPTLSATWNKEKVEEAKNACANFWYYSDIPFNVSRSPYWDYMINAVAVCGAGFKAPTYHELRGPLLQTAADKVKLIIDDQRKIWKKMGCSILSDGWTDSRGRTFINFMVSSLGGLVFLKCVDGSAHVKNADYLFGLLEEVILDVGVENVVQIITDNGTAYVSAGRVIQERFPTIFWSPCAAHCLDLLLEDIGKIDWVREVVNKARNISKFIYNHPWVLNLMRSNFTNNKDIVRSVATRFATTFIALQSLHEHKAALKQMFVSNEWLASRYTRDNDAMLVVGWCFDESFWNAGLEILQFSEPLVKVLRLVDGDKPPMGYIYEAMDRAKEAISAYYRHDQSRYGPLWEIIDRRWTRQLHRPLHAAGYYLNPKFFYSDSFEADEEVSTGFQLCIEHMHSDVETRAKIADELVIYRGAQGYLFSSPQCIYGRDHQAPDQWWEDYGAKTPNLKKMAVRILSQTCSASGCERNWSAFENIQSKKRSRLNPERLNDLVFVHYNLHLRHKQIQGQEDELIELDEIDPSHPLAEWLILPTPEPEQEQPASDQADPNFTGLSFEDWQERESREAEAVATSSQVVATSSQAPPLVATSLEPRGRVLRERRGSKGKERE